VVLDPGSPGGERPVIAIDGKTVHGANRKRGKAPHLAAALAHGTGAVPGQVAAEEKSNEIPAARELPKAFAGPAAVLLTTGALHTQHDTARAILERQPDHVMTVKPPCPRCTGSSGSSPEPRSPPPRP